MTPATRPQPDPGTGRVNLVAGVLAAVLPGLGHLYLGQARRAAYAAAAVLGLFFGGLLIGGIDVVDAREDKWWFVGQAFVGLTMECARCHDHKFDPVPIEDYYALAGIFHSTRKVQRPITMESEARRQKRRRRIALRNFFVADLPAGDGSWC